MIRVPFFLVGMLVLAVLLSFAGGASAEKLTVATEELPPYNFTDSNGVVSGVSTEIVRAVLEEAGADGEIQSYPWARAYKMALNRENVLIYSIVKTQQREDLFKWVGKIVAANSYFYKLKSRVDIKIDSLEDAKAYKVGVVGEDVDAQFLIEQGFENLDIESDSVHNIKKLFLGRVDMVSKDEGSFIYELKRLGMDIDKVEKVRLHHEIPSEMYLACSNKTPDKTVARLRGALKKIKEDGRYEKIIEKWFK